MLLSADLCDRVVYKSEQVDVWWYDNVGNDNVLNEENDEQRKCRGVDWTPYYLVRNSYHKFDEAGWHHMKAAI